MSRSLWNGKRDVHVYAEGTVYQVLLALKRNTSCWWWLKQIYHHRPCTVESELYVCSIRNKPEALMIPTMHVARLVTYTSAWVNYSNLTVFPHWNHGLYMGNHPQIVQHFRFVKRFNFPMNNSTKLRFQTLCFLRSNGWSLRRKKNALSAGLRASSWVLHGSHDCKWWLTNLNKSGC